MIKRSLCVLAVLLVGSGLAWAAPEISWSGFYVGANVGLARHAPNWTDNDYDWFGGTLTNPYVTILPGVTLGFNHQFGSLVIGFEADGAIGFMENEIEYDIRSGSPDHYVTKTDKLKMLITARVRMGFVVDTALFYMTAGAGLPSASHSWIEWNDAPDSWELFTNSTPGTVLGLGVEHRMGTALSIKVEFLCFKNSPKEFPNEETSPGPYLMSLDETIESLRFGVNYKF